MITKNEIPGELGHNWASNPFAPGIEGGVLTHGMIPVQVLQADGILRILACHRMQGDAKPPSAYVGNSSMRLRPDQTLRSATASMRGISFRGLSLNRL